MWRKKQRYSGWKVAIWEASVIELLPFLRIDTWWKDHSVSVYLEKRQHQLFQQILKSNCAYVQVTKASGELHREQKKKSVMLFPTWRRRSGLMDGSTKHWTVETAVCFPFPADSLVSFNHNLSCNLASSKWLILKRRSPNKLLPDTRLFVHKLNQNLTNCVVRL